MKDKNAITLEFDKVLSYLSSYAISSLGKERCLNAVIFDDVNTIKIKYKKNKYTKISYKKYEEEIAKLGDHFMINSECIRCRMCQMDCVRENIDLIDGIITFKDKCEGCLACINNCPYGAIEYEDITRGRRRYKNPKEINE